MKMRKEESVKVIDDVYSCYSVDVCEAHFAQITALLLTFFVGQEVWYHQVS